MKCTVIKASPRGRTAGSSRAADAFIRGMEKEGAEVTEIVLRDKNIRHCTGCYACWTKTPGKCIHRDDMDGLLPVVADSDLTVYATPLYTYSVPGMLKDFMDRCLPLSQPYLIKSGDTTGHPSRRTKNGRIFVISTAGFPEKGHFDSMTGMFRHAAGSGSGIAGTILIPGAEAMANEKDQKGYSKLYAVIEKAGSETVRDGRMSEETVHALEENERERLASVENFREIANAYWKSLQPVNQDDEGYSGIRIIPGDRRCSLTNGGMESLIAGMALSYNSEAAPGLNSVFQFDFGKESYYLLIKDAECTAFEGEYPDPAFTVHSPAEVWEAVSDGTLSGSEGLMSGKYTVDGDMSLFMRMDGFFAAGSVPAETEEGSARITNGGPAGPIEKLSGGAQMTIGFLPWTLLWILSPLAGIGPAAVSAVTAAIVFALYRTARKRLTFFEGGTALYSVIHILVLYSGPEIYRVSAVFFQYLFLAGLWSLSLGRKDCLTAEYIGADYPAAARKTPAFADTNRILTAAWSLYFMISAASAYLAGLIKEGTVLTIAPYILLAAMFIFTGWFQRWYPRRLMRARG